MNKHFCISCGSHGRYRIVDARLIDSVSGFYIPTYKDLTTGHIFEATSDRVTEPQIEFENQMADLLEANRITDAEYSKLIGHAHSGYQQRARYWYRRD